MEPVNSWVACQPHIAAVRRSSPAYTSNFYARPDQVESWCASGRLAMLRSEGALLLLLQDTDFRHVYHLAEDGAALTRALQALSAGIYTADLIGQGDALAGLCARYAEAGFVRHDYLRRMTRVQAPGTGVPTSMVGLEPEIASPEDAATVLAFLQRLLDRFTEQLPDLAELESAAAAGRLLIVRRGIAIAGMLMYDLKGQLGHLRFWHVDDMARGEGVGRRLMAGFLSRCAEARRLVLWVKGDNTRSIAIYRHYGFAEDGLQDHILVCHKDIR